MFLPCKSHEFLCHICIHYTVILCSHARSFTSMTNTKQHKKRRYITRGLGKMFQSIADKFMPWPTCEVHYDLVTTNFDLYSWVWFSIGDPHAPIHNWLGGNLDCDATYNEIGNLVGADVAEVLAYLGSGYRKMLFCDRIWGCTRTVSVDEKPSEVRT